MITMQIKPICTYFLSGEIIRCVVVVVVVVVAVLLLVIVAISGRVLRRLTRASRILSLRKLL